MGFIHFTLFNHKVFKPIRMLIQVLVFAADFIQDRKSITHFFLPESYGLGMMAALLTFLKAPKLMSRRSLNLYQEKYPGFKQLEIFLHKNCDVVLGNSQAVVDQLHKEECVPLEKLKLLYNGIPISSPEVPSDVRERLGLKADDVVMILVANLIPYKGHKDLLDALGTYKDKLPKNWKLLCVGRDDGIQVSLEEQAKELGIAEQIMWLGSRTDVPDLLQASDIGILCSHQEGFSNAVLEAMAAALPMVVTDVGGNAEAVLDGETGLVVEARNPDALGQALVRLANDPILSLRMGEAGRARVIEHFSLEKCVQTYHDLYQSLNG